MAKELVSSSSSRKKVYDIIQAFKTETVARSITPLRDGNLLEMILAMTKEEVDMLENLLSLHAQSSIGTIHIDDLNRDLTDNFTVYQAGLLPCFKIVFGSAEHGDFEKVVGFLKTFTFGANITQILQCSYVKDSQNPAALKPGNAIFTFIRTYTPSSTNGAGADLLAWKEYRQENATVSSDGWMSKEDKKKLNALWITRIVNISFNNLVPVARETPMSIQIDGEETTAEALYSLLQSSDSAEFILSFRDTGGSPYYQVYNRTFKGKSYVLYGLVKPTSADYSLEIGMEVTAETVSVISVSQFYLTNASQAHDGFMSKADKKKLDSLTGAAPGSSKVYDVSLFLEKEIPEPGDSVQFNGGDYVESIEDLWTLLMNANYHSVSLSLDFTGTDDFRCQLLSSEFRASDRSSVVSGRCYRWDRGDILDFVFKVTREEITVLSCRSQPINYGIVRRVNITFDKRDPEFLDNGKVVIDADGDIFSASDLYYFLAGKYAKTLNLRIKFGDDHWVNAGVTSIEEGAGDLILIYFTVRTKFYMISLDGVASSKDITFRGLVTDLTQTVNSVPTDIVKQWFKETEH